MFELCWQLGGRDCLHPDFLARRLTLRQLAGWIAWLQKEPRGERRADARAALQTKHLRAPWVGQDEDPDAFRLRCRDAEPEITDPEVAALVDRFLQPLPTIGF